MITKDWFCGVIYVALEPVQIIKVQKENTILREDS